MTTIPPIIELRGVTKRFAATRRSGEVLAVENLDLAVPDRSAMTPGGAGEFLVLLGPSGCGKSTILTMISGVALPESGEVRVYDKPVSGPDKSSATVPQAYTCFPWLNALENVEFGLSLQGMPEAKRRRIAMEYLGKVGLAEFAGAYHRQLSGGMQQRVAIARTLALKRPIVLMDEPFGALDAQTRADMQQMLLQLWKEEKNTIVFVTHDITEALLLADRILVFSPRPARIIEDLTVPFNYDRPPEIVHERNFIQCSEKLRQLLGRYKTGPAVLAPAPGVITARFSRTIKSVPISAPAVVPGPMPPGTPPVAPASAPAKSPAASATPVPSGMKQGVVWIWRWSRRLSRRLSLVLPSPGPASGAKTKAAKVAPTPPGAVSATTAPPPVGGSATNHSPAAHVPAGVHPHAAQPVAVAPQAAQPPIKPSAPANPPPAQALAASPAPAAPAAARPPAAPPITAAQVAVRPPATPSSAKIGAPGNARPAGAGAGLKAMGKKIKGLLVR